MLSITPYELSLKCDPLRQYINMSSSLSYCCWMHVWKVLWFLHVSIKDCTFHLALHLWLKVEDTNEMASREWSTSSPGHCGQIQLKSSTALNEVSGATKNFINWGSQHTLGEQVMMTASNRQPHHHMPFSSLVPSYFHFSIEAWFCFFPFFWNIHHWQTFMQVIVLSSFSFWWILDIAFAVQCMCEIITINTSFPHHVHHVRLVTFSFYNSIIYCIAWYSMTLNWILYFLKDYTWIQRIHLPVVLCMKTNHNLQLSLSLSPSLACLLASLFAW